jgi:mono/diheme cytochrome c family protein
MIRVIVFALAVLVTADACACSRCGIFGRGCRLGHHHEVQAAAVIAAPVIQPPSIAIVNNYPPANGAAATLIAGQGGTVYGLSTAVQAYQLDPAAVLRQAAELTKGAQQLAQQGLTGYGQTAALALTLQASQPAIAAAITQPVVQPAPQSLRIELRDGKWQVTQDAPPASPSAPAPATAPADDAPPAPAGSPARGFALVSKHCGQCHGVQLATPKGGIYLGGENRDCKIDLKAVAAVMAGRMPPGSKLSESDRAALVMELSQ